MFTHRWSAVTEVDSRQMANVPLVAENRPFFELETTPYSEKPWDYLIRHEFSEPIPGVLRDGEREAQDDEYELKEIIPGICIERRIIGTARFYSSLDSSVVRAVIRLEELRIRRAKTPKIVITRRYKKDKIERTGDYPADLPERLRTG